MLRVGPLIRCCEYVLNNNTIGALKSSEGFLSFHQTLKGMVECTVVFDVCQPSAQQQI